MRHRHDGPHLTLRRQGLSDSWERRCRPSPMTGRDVALQRPRQGCVRVGAPRRLRDPPRDRCGARTDSCAACCLPAALPGPDRNGRLAGPRLDSNHERLRRSLGRARRGRRSAVRRRPLVQMPSRSGDRSPPTTTLAGSSGSMNRDRGLASAQTPCTGGETNLGSASVTMTTRQIERCTPREDALTSGRSPAPTAETRPAHG